MKFLFYYSSLHANSVKQLLKTQSDVFHTKCGIKKCRIDRLYNISGMRHKNVIPVIDLVLLNIWPNVNKK